MAYRSVRIDERALRNVVASGMSRLGTTATNEAKSEAGRKLTRRTGNYAGSFRSTTTASGPHGPRLRIENTAKTADGRPLAPIIEHGSRPHVIRPKKAGGMLVFEIKGETVFAREVNHPGTKPYRIMETALRRAVARWR